MKKLYKINVSTWTKCMTLILAIIISACDDFVKLEPPKNEIVGVTVYSNDASALSAIAGLYASIMGNPSSFADGSNGISYLTGLTSDELINYNPNQSKIQFYTNDLTEDAVLPLWSELYNTIYFANSIIEGLSNSMEVSTSVKNQLKGEATFIRAFCLFNLVNLLGNIPVPLTTDYEINNKLPRQSTDEVYSQIMEDFTLSVDLLADDFSFSKNERTRPGKWAAKAMLARAYLYRGNWIEAESLATEIIQSNLFALNPDLNETFLKNSAEAIWQLAPVQQGFNTLDGSTFILIDYPNEGALSDWQFNAFELNDLRKTNWTASIDVDGQVFNYPYKYKVKNDFTVSEYQMVLRLAEQYLIRAEARAYQNKLTQANEDVNVIRQRAGLAPVTLLTQSDLIAAVMKERRAELFCEWGHRWYDLKRVGLIDSELSAEKQGWSMTDALFPVPASEIRNNPNLLPQNPGY